MKHYATSRFWACYARLPQDVQVRADKKFELLKSDPKHPSLHFKKIGQFWSVRIGLHWRALGLDIPEHQAVSWFWIGTHDEYDRLIS